MTEFRCTRNAPYVTANCLGNQDTSSRQGYYVCAASKKEALKIMSAIFPAEVKDGFTVELK
ncbi:hypothetical protein F7734_53400 [Scytonema sp. UIC 10036]|uniref:hypothetical protein n=1 Tax=Scytonema sp. UIC 10036 TaxID=2304196 RepID=UPI0012DAB49B|nr:hypothetical protein [Scytonema sp. UIC 10036]MUH00606.1 hypothetical protein [Scytonema sp. UIC 10036]